MAKNTFFLAVLERSGLPGYRFHILLQRFDSLNLASSRQVDATCMCTWTLNITRAETGPLTVRADRPCPSAWLQLPRRLPGRALGGLPSSLVACRDRGWICSLSSSPCLLVFVSSDGANKRKGRVAVRDPTLSPLLPISTLPTPLVLELNAP